MEECIILHPDVYKRQTESLNEDIFDCEYTSVDAVINEVTVFTGCKERQTENGTRTCLLYTSLQTVPNFICPLKLTTLQALPIFRVTVIMVCWAVGR